MKKLNFAIFGACLLTALATGALAETTIPWTKAGCESVKGTWITAHSATDSGCDAAHCNGMSFCRSASTATWFNALIWCKSIGRNLASFSHLCPGDVTQPGVACANMRLGGSSHTYLWSSMPWNSTQALYTTMAGGSGAGDRNRTVFVDRYSYAVCE